jgi:hypothetical protein
MSTNQISKARVIAGALAFRNDGTSTTYGTYKGTATLDPGSINADVVGTVTFTLTGAKAGDMIIMQPPALTAGLAYAGAEVTADNTVTVYLANITEAPVDGASQVWRYFWFDQTV